MAGSSEDKTLPASAKKLRDARNKGQVAKSKDFVSASVTLAAVGFVIAEWNSMIAHFVVLIDHVGDLSEEPFALLLPIMISLISETTSNLVLPLLMFLVFATIVSSVIATNGLVLSLDPLMPKLQRLDPMAGLKKVFSIKGLIEVAKSLFKLVLVGAVTFVIIRGALQALVDLPACGLSCTGQLLQETLLPLASTGALLFLIFGLADLLLQRWLFLLEQRMSHTEKKQERKNSDGNPLIKSAHKRERRELIGKRSGLGQATFLITGMRVAVAMRYSVADTRVPTLVARAEADDVNRFIQDGRALKLPLLHEPELARALFSAVIGHTIPRELFEPVIMGMKRLGILSS